jgi:hypothetical protein
MCPTVVPFAPSLKPTTFRPSFLPSISFGPSIAAPQVVVSEVFFVQTYNIVVPGLTTDNMDLVSVDSATVAGPSFVSGSSPQSATACGFPVSSGVRQYVISRLESTTLKMVLVSLSLSSSNAVLVKASLAGYSTNLLSQPTCEQVLNLWTSRVNAALSSTPTNGNYGVSSLSLTGPATVMPTLAPTEQHSDIVNATNPFHLTTKSMIVAGINSDDLNTVTVSSATMAGGQLGGATPQIAVTCPSLIANSAYRQFLVYRKLNNVLFMVLTNVTIVQGIICVVSNYNDNVLIFILLR